MGSTLPVRDTLAELWQANRALLPMYSHLLISALFPIYTGSYASLSRPSSAAEPPKKKRKAGSTDDDEEDEDEDVVQKMEGLSPKDAITLPLTAGCVLGGLYFLIKRYGADLINLILGVYFSGIGVISVAKLINDGLTIFLDFTFPTFIASKGKLWKADWPSRNMVEVNRDGKPTSTMPSSIDAAPSRIWTISAPFKTKYTTKLHIPAAVTFRGDLTLIHLLSVLFSLSVIAYTNLISKPWPLTNLQGFAVSYAALQLLSPTSFTTGSLILAALFAYDIWAVFFTPLMVTVATKLDQPIKLVFPRPDGKTFGMLGLGDIVLPGMMIALALRFDLYLFYLKKQEKKKTGEQDSKTAQSSNMEVIEKAHFISPTGLLGSRFWTSSLSSDKRPARLSAHIFPKPYFSAAMIGYVVGMLSTLGVMTVFRHAQPALLYLVPGVLGALWGTGLARRELKLMWEFTEAGELFGEDEKKVIGKEAVVDDRSWLQWMKEELLGGGTDSNKQDEKKNKKDEKDEENKKATEKATQKQDDVLISFSVTRKPSRPFTSNNVSDGAANTVTRMGESPGQSPLNNSAPSSKLEASKDDEVSEEDAVIV